MKTRDAGKEWEDIAADFLKKRGYKILTRNYTSCGGEVDIIAEKKGILVFVEVRGRSTDAFMEPFESIDARKMRKILKAAASFLKSETRKKWKSFRMDVISIVDGKVNHLEDAFNLDDAGIDSLWGGFYA